MRTKTGDDIMPNDDREFDAFVSYASADWDRQFVIQTLVPRLEGRMCFTLCIHQRNFVPGLFITDNIVESVRKSRRTLLIISPAFINSGWCKFEYQMALQEMLNQKHRILPILIGDVKNLRSEMDDTLDSILKAVTWLEYPDKSAKEQEYEKFWKRLALSMPKKRPTSNEEYTNSPSCLTPPSPTTPETPSADPKAPLELRSFNPVDPKSLPALKQIVRVPADNLEVEEKPTSPLAAFFNRLLGRSGSSDSSSIEDTPESSSLEPYLVQNKSEPSTPNALSPKVNGTGVGYTGDQIWNGINSENGYSPQNSGKPVTTSDETRTSPYNGQVANNAVDQNGIWT